MTEKENEMTAMNTSGKRQIKASEVKPGMEIEIVTTRKMTVDRVSAWGDSDWELSDDSGHVAWVNAGAKITVLSEPQPVEPRWIAARAKVGDRRFFRVDESDRPWRKADCMGRVSPYRYSWSDVCSMGPVTVIPDQGWTVPAEPTPVVPEKLYVWPENDEHLRGHKWCDNDGDTVQYSDGAWRYLWPSGPGAAHAAPLESAPWTRTDAMSEEIGASDWPEDDGHLRGHSWRDHNGNIWTWNKRHSEWDCKDPCGRFLICLSTPSHGPWTRKND